LFGGYVGKNAKDVFKRVREKIITLLVIKIDKRVVFFFVLWKDKELSSNSEKVRSFY